MFFLVLFFAIILNINAQSLNKTHNVDISIMPDNVNLIYDIGLWTSKLHLQTCAIVEVGEGYCSIFLEDVHPSTKTSSNYFLGICDCQTVSSWQLCSPALTKRRLHDCTFSYNSVSEARVHRRLCDIIAISEWAPQCNCSKAFMAKRLMGVDGFPTCFRNPLPRSICTPNPCGTAKCGTQTIAGGVHKLNCYSKCFQRQPFCETVGPESSKFRTISSSWDKWECKNCSNADDSTLFVATAKCLENVSRKPALDCLGPGTHCCTNDMGSCTCTVSNRDGYLEVTRSTQNCIKC